MTRIIALIDGVELYATSKALGIDVDYKRLLYWLREEGTFVRAYYFTLLEDSAEYSGIRPLVDWLEYNGYTMVTKPPKRREDGIRKNSMHVEFAVLAMELGQSCDHLFLFTGDGEYASLVEALKRQGKRVTVVSTITTRPPMVSDALRRAADEFIDLQSMVGQFAREPVKR